MRAPPCVGDVVGGVGVTAAGHDVLDQRAPDTATKRLTFAAQYCALLNERARKTQRYLPCTAT